MRMGMEVEEVVDDERQDSESVGPRWELFPLHLWEGIFSLLPISTLTISSTVCRSWLSTIRSPHFLSLYRSLPHPHQDLLFLLFSIPTPPLTAAAYHPHLDRWLRLPLPSPCRSPLPCCSLLRLHVSGGSHLLLELCNGAVLTSNAFTRASQPIAPMIFFHASPYALALLEGSPAAYRIIAVSTSDRVRSQVYDSETRRWVMKGELDLRVAVVGNAASLDGVLFCLTRGPDALLVFDPAEGTWDIVDVPVPALVCSHVVACVGRLLLVGGVEELGDVVGIGVWEMEWGERTWREVGAMPNGLFRRFSGFQMNCFEVVDRRGLVCFCNMASGSIVVCDLGTMRWWRPAPCPFAISRSKEAWLGHAVEPRVELLLPPE